MVRFVWVVVYKIDEYKFYNAKSNNFGTINEVSKLFLFSIMKYCELWCVISEKT